VRGVRRPRRGLVEVDVRERDHDDERRHDDGEGDDHRCQEADCREQDDDDGDGLIVIVDRELDE
jgi:hypothetical protein